MCQPWGEKKRRRYLKQSQFECWMQSSKKRKKSSLCLSRNKERISSRISSCPKRLYNTSQVTHKCRTKIQLHFRFQYDAIHSLKFYHQWPRPGASTRSPSVYLCWPAGTREFLWVLCGRPAGSQRCPSGPLLLLAALHHHNHHLLHPSADPLCLRWLPCKQTCAGPEAHKRSLKSSGGNMYLYKYQPYWLDIIGKHSHTFTSVLKVHRLQKPRRIPVILGSYGLSVVGPIPFLEQTPHTEKPCPMFIAANLKTGQSLFEGRDGKSGGTKAVSRLYRPPVLSFICTCRLFSSKQLEKHFISIYVLVCSSSK